jgi:hypothetical protein
VASSTTSAGPPVDQFDDQFAKGIHFIRTTELAIALVYGHFQVLFGNVNANEGL